MSFRRRASHEFWHAVGQAIVTSFSLLVPSSLSPFVPRPFVSWSFFGLLATRYSLAASSTLTFNLNRSARRVRSDPCFGVSELLSGMTALFRMAD
jgi:hypothetical protein